jgi:hypothetical protein
LPGTRKMKVGLDLSNLTVTSRSFSESHLTRILLCF